MTTTDTQVTVQRTIDAPSSAVFDVLTDPQQHVALDGSGFVISVAPGSGVDRITGTGQQFTMNMTGDHMGGDYQTDNTVTGFDPNHLIAWKTAPAGQEPPGWEWVWELSAEGSDSTRVTLTYDWSKVEDKALLAKVGFPLVSEHELEQSLGHLAEAVTG